jgi:hypothetical protein
MVGKIGDPRIQTDYIFGTINYSFNLTVQWIGVGPNEIDIRYAASGELAGVTVSSIKRQKAKRGLSFGGKILNYDISILGAINSQSCNIWIVVPVGAYGGITGDVMLSSAAPNNFDWSGSTIFNESASVWQMNLVDQQFVFYDRVQTGEKLASILLVFEVVGSVVTTSGDIWDNLLPDGVISFDLDLDYNAYGNYITGSDIETLSSARVITEDDLIDILSMIDDVENEVILTDDAINVLEDRFGNKSFLDTIGDIFSDVSEFFAGSGGDIVKMAISALSTIASFMIPEAAAVIKPIEGALKGGIEIIADFDKNGNLPVDKTASIVADISADIMTTVKGMSYAGDAGLSPSDMFNDMLVRMKNTVMDHLASPDDSNVTLSTVSVMVSDLLGADEHVVGPLKSINTDILYEDNMLSILHMALMFTFVNQNDATTRDKVLIFRSENQTSELNANLFGVNGVIVVRQWSEVFDQETMLWTGMPGQIKNEISEHSFTNVSTKFCKIKKPQLIAFVRALGQVLGMSDLSVSLLGSYADFILEFATNFSIPDMLKPAANMILAAA